MKLGTIRHEGEATLIVHVRDQLAAPVAAVYSLAALGLAPRGLGELIERGRAEAGALSRALREGAAEGVLIDISQADWLAPHGRPMKILGIAVNNNELNKNAWRKPTHPMIFMKGATALTGHGKPIELMQEHGYSIPEPELAAVLGRGGKNIPESEALDCVFGYTITNDITASGVKFTMDSVALNIGAANLRPHHTVWRQKFGDEDNYLYFTYHTRSKASDTFAPMGPWLTTADEIRNPNALAVRSWTAGELYTEDSTANYMFSIQRCIAEASRFFTLEVGDIIHFGTAGKGVGRFATGNRAVNLQETDGPIDIEIEGLGRLSNPIRHV